MFEPGDKVVCVDVRPKYRLPLNIKQAEMLVLGRAYTVREMFIGHTPQGEEVPAVRLVEIICPIHIKRGYECGYTPTRFRKIEGDREAWDALMAASKPKTVKIIRPVPFDTNR